MAWVFRLQKAKLELKDQEIKIVERERDSARATSTERLDLATRLRDDAEKQLKQVLQEKGLAEKIQASGVAELGQESKDLLRSLLDRIQGLEQLAPVAESAESHFLKGNAHFGAGELDLAFTEYSLAISLNPEYANAYGNRGAAYGEKGDYDSAIEDFDRAIRLNPEYAQAYYNRGNAYSSKGEHDTAIEDFDRAISLNPDLFQAYTNRSHIYNHIGEYDKAIADSNRAIEFNPEAALHQKSI